MMGIEWLKPAVLFGSIIFAVIGVVVLWLCFVVLDKLTPQKLWTEISERGNLALAIFLGAVAIAILQIIARPSTARPNVTGRRAGPPQARPDPPGGSLDVPGERGAVMIQPAELALLASVFVVAACGLVYELAAGALASYLLGDSILQFSTVIGTYLFAMGIGSWLSRFFDRQLVAHFLRIELLVGLIGGLMPAALFASIPWRHLPSASRCTASSSRSAPWSGSRYRW